MKERLILPRSFQELAANWGWLTPKTSSLKSLKDFIHLSIWKTQRFRTKG